VTSLNDLVKSPGNSVKNIINMVLHIKNNSITFAQ
jgi:hypothetical protein